MASNLDDPAVRRRVEQLLESLLDDRELPADVVEWLSKLPDALCRRLAPLLTMEQKARVYEQRLAIEKALAKERQREAGRKSGRRLQKTQNQLPAGNDR